MSRKTAGSNLCGEVVTVGSVLEGVGHTESHGTRVEFQQVEWHVHRDHTPDKQRESGRHYLASRHPIDKQHTSQVSQLNVQLTNKVSPGVIIQWSVTQLTNNTSQGGIIERSATPLTNKEKSRCHYSMVSHAINKQYQSRWHY